MCLVMNSFLWDFSLLGYSFCPLVASGFVNITSFLKEQCLCFIACIFSLILLIAVQSLIISCHLVLCMWFLLFVPESLGVLLSYLYEIFPHFLYRHLLLWTCLLEPSLLSPISCCCCCCVYLFLFIFKKSFSVLTYYSFSSEIWKICLVYE